MGKKRGKTDLSEVVKVKAKELWEKGGCKQDNDLEYWLEAEKIVKGQTNK